MAPVRHTIPVRAGVAALAVALVFGGCSSGSSSFEPRDSPTAVPDVGDDRAADSTPTPANAADPPVVGEADQSDPALSEVAGLIAVADADGLRLLSAAGDVVTTAREGDVVRQPTWSRDGRRLAATHIDTASGVANVMIVDPVADLESQVRLEPAARPYFFYSWSHDGTRIAALGSGPSGTSMDVLDSDGRVVSRAPLDAGSLFVAWEPDGDDLIVNADGELAVLDGADDAFVARPLGPAGVPFQAPLWLDDRNVLLVLGGSGPTPTLARLDVDSGATTDLGSATSATFIAVAPDRARAVLAHAPADGGAVAASLQAAAEIAATVEVVDLRTGERSPVGNAAAVWAEWSRDSSTVLVASVGDGSLGWDVWSAGTVRHLVDFAPSADFVQNYLRFAPAYIESPRLWSPDGSAITYGAQVDGRDVAMVMRVGEGGRPVSVGAGSVAFWSPGPPG